MIEIRDDFDVDLVQFAGSDEFIGHAARVSTKEMDLDLSHIPESDLVGLINFLAKNRHGSPFEHGLMTFRICAPILMWREFMRHRIGWSYNEQSGRYMEFHPVFYIPNEQRPLVQVGKPGAYEFIPGNQFQYDVLTTEDERNFERAWDSYQTKLKAGIAKEVARNNLPFATYSSAYATCNPRSLLAFLSLRTKDEDSLFPSYPQWEINQVANQMEAIFAQKFPITHQAFIKARRVAP
jgi:thymidylate synthase (FAD)